VLSNWAPNTSIDSRLTLFGVHAEYPLALQAATQMTVEDVRARWTTHNNLNQWFNDVIADLLSTGMVVDEVELEEKGWLVVRDRFKPVM
jgi:hypothetical protein